MVGQARKEHVRDAVNEARADYTPIFLSEVPALFREDISGRSIHSGITPIYYVYKMCLSLFVTLLRRAPTSEEVEPNGS